MAEETDTPTVYHPEDGGPNPPRLGRLLRVVGHTAWFEHGQLRCQALGPPTPTREAWWEPVQHPESYQRLLDEGHQVRRELTSVFGLDRGAHGVGYVLVEATDRYVIDGPGFARLIAAARHRQERPLRSLHRFTARALAHLAPQTPVRTGELREILALRADRIRQARPSDGLSGSRLSRVGAWLDGLFLERPTPLRSSGRRGSPPPVRALGGPPSTEGEAE